MNNKLYLTFNLNDSIYGVEALAVQEVFFLPELTPIPEAPSDIIGVVNLRGEILPVMDLDLRLGHHSQEYCLTDSLIVLELQGFRIGIVVNQVYEVQSISMDAIATDLSYGRKVVTHPHFIVGVAKVADDIVMLLNYENLIRYSQLVQPFSEDAIALPLILSQSITERRVFCPNATPQARAIFRERAENLMQLSDQDSAELIPLAVVGLSGEYFGLNLEVVREFTDVRKVTPIPCCPTHIIGNMNLRGEIVTLIDIRSVLNIPTIGAGTTSKAMVVQIDDVVAGVAIDEVFDVIYLRSSEIEAIPIAVNFAGKEYLRGATSYREKLMAILDLPEMIASGELAVDDEVSR